jgi:hypothetical protein
MESGKLEKLRIDSYSEIDFSPSSRLGESFEAYLNPEELTIDYSVNMDNSSSAGQYSSKGVFLNIEPVSITLNFFLDGTGVTGIKVEVDEEIRKFYKTVGYNGDRHEPRFLRIIWGNMRNFRGKDGLLDCRLTSASVNYKMFKPDGTPIRAVITASFMEVMSAEEQVAEAENSSPDLTHVRVVKEGDTLPAMTWKIYGDFGYYTEVARVNRLSNFRNLAPGQEIIFPPFDKNIKTRK